MERILIFSRKERDGEDVKNSREERWSVEVNFFSRVRERVMERGSEERQSETFEKSSYV